MDLNYKHPPVNLGGSAIKDCGTIHIDEIVPTLNKLSEDLKLNFNLNDYVIGSAGKRDYSGDIDLVIDPLIYKSGMKKLRDDLISLYGQLNVIKHGDKIIHLKYPIVCYNESNDLRLPRTGFVQIDLNEGDYKWESFIHYSHGKLSAYKSVQRNILISSILSVIDVISSDELDLYDRPTIMYRWRLGSKGFCRIKRYSYSDPKTGICYKNQRDELLQDPYFDIQFVASTMFKKDGNPSDLNSVETLIDAVKRNCDMTEQTKIWKVAAQLLTEWSDGNQYIYPYEIGKYIKVS